jgi:hypothetical protein
VISIAEKHFSQHRGLENLSAALAKQYAQAGAAASSSASQSFVAARAVISDYHEHDHRVIAAKIKESLEHKEMGFISRIFSDLNATYLTKKKCEKLAEEYLDLLKDLSKEYNHLLFELQISDEQFLEMERDNKKDKKFNKMISLFKFWLYRIVLRGQKEIFDNNGDVKHEIIHLLIAPINPSNKSIRGYILEFQKDIARQGLVSAYFGLVFQEILKSIPHEFLDKIPKVVKHITSKLIKAHTIIPARETSNENKDEISESKSALPDLEEVDVNELTIQYQSAVATLNTTVQQLIKDVLAHITKPEHAKTLFAVVSKVNAAKGASVINDSFIEIMEALKTENYANPDDKVYYAIMLLASIFTGKDNAFTKANHIWSALGITDDLTRRKCGQEALDIFKTTIAEQRVEVAVENQTPISLAPANYKK